MCRSSRTLWSPDSRLVEILDYAGNYESEAVDELVEVVAGLVASGNDGTQRTELADPAVDPMVIAVGVDDSTGSKIIRKGQAVPFTLVLEHILF